MPPQISPTLGHQCWSGGSADYPTSGCEHFGVSLRNQPTAIHYRWLIADGANPGSVVRFPIDVQIPGPTWSVVPPAVVGDPPLVKARVPAKEVEAGFLFGDAQWVKVFKTEVDRDARLEELLSDNPLVPRSATETEVEWEILQKGAGKPHNGDDFHAGLLGAGRKAIVRRYEFYKYTGAYDAESHEALCLDGNCNKPAPGELGDYIGAQMAAVDVGDKFPVRPKLTVSRTGLGKIASSPAGISAPLIRAARFEAGSTVTLTARPARGYAFNGWTGACSGMELTCTVTLSQSLTKATANFVAVP